MKVLHVFTVFITPLSFFDGQFRYLVDEGYDIAMACGESPEMEGFIMRNGVQFVPINITRKLSLRGILKSIRDLNKTIRDIKPDAVFGHTPVGSLCAMIAATICRIPKRVYYRHGLLYTTQRGPKRWLFQEEERLVSMLATDIINVSPSLGQLAVHDRLNPENKQHLIGFGTCGGIDTKGIFNPENIDSLLLNDLRTRLNYSCSDFICGFCGRISCDKGIPELIDGFELFQTRHSDIRAKLLLIGTLDERDRLSEERRMQIMDNPNIVLTGWIDKKEIPLYMALMNVFVFPSHREGFGMSVLEAGAMCIPALVSRSHGCIDSIVEHETGEYIELNADSICRGLNLMLDPVIRGRMGKTARQYVTEHFDCSVMWPMVKKLYDDLLV